jgi:zinc/manganese transport system substrate-binding protein
MVRYTLFLILFLIAMPTSAGAKVKVVATVPDLGAIISAIGGEHIQLTTLLKSQDPHFADGKPSYLVSLRQADLLVVNGMNLESSWLVPLVSNARNGRILAGSSGHLDTSARVRKREIGQTDRAMGDIHPAGNPHYLTDPREVLTVAADIGQRLARLDPVHAQDYLIRTRAFRKAVFLYAKRERTRFMKLPAAKRRIVSYHRSMAYLANWLGLQIVAEIEPKPGIPPTPSHVARVLSRMKANNVKAILQMVYYPRSTTKKLATLTGATPVYLGASKSPTYLARMKAVTQQLYILLAK